MFYKVVYYDNLLDQRMSFMRAFHNLNVIYTPREWSVPNPNRPKEFENYGLCVFETFEQVLSFREEYSGTIPGFEIWECICEDEITPIPRRLVIDDTIFHSLCYSVYSWPKGTRMFKRVKLTNLK